MQWVGVLAILCGSAILLCTLRDVPFHLLVIVRGLPSGIGWGLVVQPSRFTECESRLPVSAYAKSLRVVLCWIDSPTCRLFSMNANKQISVRDAVGSIG